MTITVKVTENADKPEHDGWHQLCDFPEFVKWQYKDGPYRVIAMMGDRGHWKVIFTTTFYKSESYLVKGNLGGGTTGRMKEKTIAKRFIEENENGCPPPGDMK